MTKKITDPRTRMQEVRTMVKKAIKNNTRLDLVPLDVDDTKRLIIALQDQLHKKNNAHDKATKLILNLKEEIKENQKYINDIQKEYYYDKIKYMNIILDRDKNIETFKNKITELNQKNTKYLDNFYKDKENLFKKDQQLKAAIKTIETMFINNKNKG
jgi:nicotinamide mononucleotide adenylyltransferase